LLVEEFSSHLVKTPSLLCRDVVGSRKTSFEITDRKNIFATMTSCLKGPEFELFNQLYTNYSINDQDEFLREYIPYPSLGIRKWELKTMDRDFAEIHLVADLVFNNFAQHYSNNIILEPFAREIPEFSPPDKRSQPVKINYPICYCDTLVFTFSPSMKVDQFPEDKIITSPFGKYERILSKAGNTITVIKNIEIFTGFYSLNQYPEFYKFITEVKKTEKSKLLFKTN